MWKFTQRSWVGGRLDAELRGRQDLSKYFQGASELVNFTVRRQGLLSKRRGTSLVARLTGLFSKQIVAARLIPLVYEKEQGYAILFASDGSTTKAYRVSKNGIDTATAVKVPYASETISDINYTQSGDTVFLAHRDYPPAKIVHSNGAISYSTIDFSETKWEVPRITGIKASGQWKEPEKDATSVSEKTVSYIATYVKDGIESAPSNPRSYSYTLPWGDTCALTISVDKGANKDEPDYYNLYKKEYTDYGIISSAKWLKPVYANPSGGTGQKIVFSGSVASATGVAPTLETTSIDSLYNISEDSYTSIGTANPETARTCSTPLTLNFGEQSGLMISRVTLLLDFIVRYAYWDDPNPETSSLDYNHTDYLRICTTANSFDIHATFKNLDTGDPIIVNKTVTVTPATSVKITKEDGTQQTISLPQGISDAAITGRITSVPSIGSTYTVSFSDLLREKGYTEESNLCITKLEFPLNGTINLRGISFSSDWGSKNEFVDDYVTPDLTQTPPTAEPHFNTAVTYPGCVGIDQQRLIFASSRSEPAKFWMSCIGDLYNFNMHDSVREDDAIAAELAATSFPNINHLIVGRDLLLLTEGGEWVVSPVSGNSITYKTISSKLQSSYGCSPKIKPILVGDEIVFLNRAGETLRATRYSYTTDGYESIDLSVLSQWITKNNPIVDIAYRQSPDSTIECVLEDGTLAVLVYMKEHEVCAWTRFVLPQEFKFRSVVCTQGITNGSSEILYLVEQNGAWELWRERDDIPIRDESTGVDPSLHLCLDRLRELASGEAPVSVEYAFTANGKRYAGLPFTSILETMPPEPQGSDGTIQMEIKNAKDAEVRVLQSGDFTMRSVSVPDSLKVAGGVNAALTNGKLYLETKDVHKLLAGRNGSDGRLRLESATPFPLNILSLSINYEIQPLSGSEG